MDVHFIPDVPDGYPFAGTCNRFWCIVAAVIMCPVIWKELKN